MLDLKVKMYFRLLSIDYKFEYHNKEPKKHILSNRLQQKSIPTLRVYVPGNNILQNSPNAVTFTTGSRLSIIIDVDGIG